jgi:hypothetical protein
MGRAFLRPLVGEEAAARRRPRPAALLIVLAAASACTTLRSPHELGEAPQRYEDADWAEVLRERVDGRGRVDYAALVAHREPLDRYVALLAEVSPRNRPELFGDRDHRLAYWINAYNALTLFQVVERWPLDSVGDSSWRRLEFFVRTRFVVGGETFDLQGLENDVVRGEFGEPRVHFALNCASAGCPRLPREPFRGDRLEEQLEGGTREFLDEERNVAVEDGVVVLSEIFDWFAGDFPPDPLAWVSRYRPDLPADADVRFRPWNWALNDQAER